ncbi:DNA polymerase III subunit beta [Gammaproteobacteria bacterium]|nr:DNA polymerase III subunit beta [Gammaproteobacteria bacterium]
MDFYITKEEVVKALNTTLGVVEKRQTLPILANVLFNVDETKLKLTATDLESEISTISTISNFKSGGRVTAPAKKLSELCRLFSDLAEIHFYLDGDNLKIETSSGKYNLATLPSEDFPVFDQEEMGAPVSIKPQSLKSIINKTSFAMGNQDWRHYLNGLFLTIDNTSITSVATDAHRLALSTQNINESIESTITGIIPRKSINEIAKLLNDESENITLNLGPSSVNISASGTTFASKLIEGKFPDYEQVIPSGESSTLIVDKKSLSESLSRVSVLSSEKYRGIRLVVESGSINISANNPEQEQGEEKLSCDYSGEKIDIAFNVNYLQEILSSIDESNAEIHFFGSDKSCLITCPGTDSYKYVVMPLLI